METDRRTFLQQAGIGLAATGLAAAASAKSSATGMVRCDQLERQGPKEVIHSKRAVASSQNPIVTRTMLNVMAFGGNAADAVVAGSIASARIWILLGNPLLIATQVPPALVLLNTPLATVPA